MTESIILYYRSFLYVIPDFKVLWGQAGWDGDELVSPCILFISILL